MIETTLAKIAEKIQTVTSISDENKGELLNLLATLKVEIQTLAETESERAESITGFTQVSTHEAIRQEKNQRLLQLSLDGLASSVQGFETSHPRLVESVNAICQTLANLGI